MLACSFSIVEFVIENLIWMASVSPPCLSGQVFQELVDKEIFGTTLLIGVTL